jgi:hypothetical protein
MATTVFPAQAGSSSGLGPINDAPGTGVYKTLFVQNLGLETAWLNKVQSEAIPWPDNYNTSRNAVALGSGQIITLVVTGTERWWYGTYSPGATLIVTEQ